MEIFFFGSSMTGKRHKCIYYIILLKVGKKKEQLVFLIVALCLTRVRQPAEVPQRLPGCDLLM